MPDDPKGDVAQQQAASAEPASTTSPAPEGGETITMLKTEFEAYPKAQRDPLEKRYSDAEAELGRLRRLSKLPQEALDAEKNFKSMKRIVTALGVPEDEIEDAETVRDLELLLRGYHRNAASPASKSVQEDSQYAAFLEWQKVQAKPQGATKEVVLRGGPGGSVALNKDNIDALYLEGKVSGEKYTAFLRTGQL